MQRGRRMGHIRYSFHQMAGLILIGVRSNQHANHNASTHGGLLPGEITDFGILPEEAHRTHKWICKIPFRAVSPFL